MNVWNWVYEVFGNGSGLRYHAIVSNQLLEEWIDRELVEPKTIRRMHTISIDFAEKGLCEKIVKLNNFNGPDTVY
jgi:hypothetical protein